MTAKWQYKEAYEAALVTARELRAENAKLREERREYQATIDSLVDECADHKAENAKLRELVRWAARILTGIFPYVDYSRCTALEAVAAWKVEASKLGIEVDG